MYKLVIKILLEKIVVNSESSVFKFSERVGLVIGKSLRYILIGGIVVFITGKLGGSKTPPVPPAPLP
jgi:hypothetical protein